KTAARHGYLSVKRTLERNFSELERIFNAYGMDVGIDTLEEELETIVNEKEEAPPEQPSEKPVANGAPQKVPFLRVVKS
ncbi:MAG: hypothetical protein FJ088_02285, partial [Deltaproteobacteria bacterium]|nr:hypothetical protein [Deltaproteobacteria bacterium]